MLSTGSRDALARREEAAERLIVACQAFPSSPAGRALARQFPPIHDSRFAGLLVKLDGLKP